MSPKLAPVNIGNVLSIIMGGGQGTRLFPLTRDRSKPAVPLAGKYRLVDIPISNCINSGLRRVYLLTQFNSASLHRHISQSYKFDHFAGGFVEILAAEQTFADTSWYPGTRQSAQSLGIMQINAERRITRFVEKPKDPAALDSLKLDKAAYPRLGIQGDEEFFLASMGIYVFNRDILIKLLDNTHTDFGKHIIPGAIQTHRVFSYVFQGYWADIGTIRSFFEANLDVTSELPRFNFFDMSAPIFTRPRFLPASKINGAQIDHAVISDGCILNHCRITNSLIGVRCLVDRDSRLNRTILLGSDAFEAADSSRSNEHSGRPRIGVGTNTIIEN